MATAKNLGAVAALVTGLLAGTAHAENPLLDALSSEAQKMPRETSVSAPDARQSTDWKKHIVAFCQKFNTAVAPVLNQTGMAVVLHAQVEKEDICWIRDQNNGAVGLYDFGVEEMKMAAKDIANVVANVVLENLDAAARHKIAGLSIVPEPEASAPAEDLLLNAFIAGAQTKVQDEPAIAAFCEKFNAAVAPVLRQTGMETLLHAEIGKDGTCWIRNQEDRAVYPFKHQDASTDTNAEAARRKNDFIATQILTALPPRDRLTIANRLPALLAQ